MNFDDTQELREWRLQVRDFLKTERPNEYDPGAMSEGNVREQAWWNNWKSALSEKGWVAPCLLYTSPSPRDGLLSRMPSSA